MHATTEQLLSLRDGQPVGADAAAHVAGCERCRHALHGLEQVRADLRGLPSLDPPHTLWRNVTEAAGCPPGRPGNRWPVWLGLAASVVLGVAVLTAVLQRPDVGPTRGTTTDLIAATPAPASSVNGVSRAELLETSRQLEAALHALPAAPQVMRAGTALTIAELQDRIFEVDLFLSDPRLEPADERALWQQRVRLMDTLMQVRYAQLSDTR
jgi:hypothetical protein